MGITRRAFFPCVAIASVALAACTVPTLGPGAGNSAPVAAPVPAVVKPRPGIVLMPPAQLLLQTTDLPKGFQPLPGQSGQLHQGPGLIGATERYAMGSGATAQQLYVRLSEFDSISATTAEFKQEQGDIGRSSTALPANGQRLGDDWFGYTVVSGAGKAATFTVGVLFRERNFLGSVVRTGAPGSLQLSDVLPIAQAQVNRIAIAP